MTIKQKHVIHFWNTEPTGCVRTEQQGLLQTSLGKSKGKEHLTILPILQFFAPSLESPDILMPSLPLIMLHLYTG